MSFKTAVLGVAIGAAICIAVAATATLKLPDDLIRPIETVPAKAILIVIAVALIAILAVVVFRTVYVPTPKRYCTYLGSTLVSGALGIATMPFALFALDSFKANVQGGGGGAQPAAQIQITLAAATWTTCVIVAIAGIIGFKFAELRLKIAIREQESGPLT